MTKNMKNFLFTLLATGFLIQIGFAQSLDKTKLEQYFNVLETNNKFMGSVAISQNGKIIYTKQIGFSDIENKVKPNENTKYRIGSISKTFTTVLVFKAIEANKLKLTDKLNQYIPEVPNANEITISNLLNHRSGIHNFTDDVEYSKWDTKKTSEKELLATIIKGGSDFKPDAKASYSNSNYVLLTWILQKIYKKDYALLLNEQIIQPLHLNNTYFGKPASIKDNESFSYSLQNGNWVKHTETDMSIPLGAGAIVSTPSDLTLFSDALFNGKLVSNQNLELMKTLKDDFGMGLFQVPFNEKKGYGHTGGIDDFTSAFAHFDDQNVTIALTSNGSVFNNNNISITLASAVYNQPYELPSFKTISVTTEKLDKYLGIYASKDIPLKITFTKNNTTLIAQATGQPTAELVATDTDKFSFELAGAIMEFNPAEKTMTLKQGGQQFLFTKE
jgi:D-alanyl-D-alanine carboxypeptidase